MYGSYNYKTRLRTFDIRFFTFLFFVLNTHQMTNIELKNRTKEFALRVIKLG